jgi:DNA polymerase-1
VFEGDIKLANWKDLARYGCLDSYITVEMGMLLYPIFVKHYSFLLKLHLNFKNALFDLENQPIYIDREKLDTLYFEINQEIEEVKAEFFNKYGTINLGSNKQKSDLLFRLGYSTGKMNKPAKDGSPIMSVKDEYLQELWKKQDCDAARLMIMYNKLIKLNSSYIEATKEFMDAGYTPRFHYLDSRVPTGRLACGKYSIKRKPYLYFLPINGQALPKNKSILREVEVDLSKSFEFTWVDEQTDTSICVETQSPHLNYRTVLTAAPGCYLVRADFSAEEIYVAAGVSQEPSWVQAMRDELDLHKATASAMFNVPYDEVDGNMRSLAKTCNFGLLYGGNEYTMHSRFGTSLDEARAFIKTYESGLPTLYRWKAIEAQKARTSGFVRNEFGHERRLQYYFKSKDYRISGRDGFAERSTWNSIIQGSCGIIMRLALFKCWKSIYYPGGRWYKSGVEFIITVHDEVDFSVPEEHMAEFIPWIKWTLESCTPLSLSRLGLHLKVGLEYGKNFGETIPINAVWDKGDSYQKEFDPEGWTFHVDSSKRDEPKTAEEVDEESVIKDEEVEDETYEEVNGFAF